MKELPRGEVCGMASEKAPWPEHMCFVLEQKGGQCTWCMRRKGARWGEASEARVGQ